MHTRGTVRSLSSHGTFYSKTFLQRWGGSRIIKIRMNPFGIPTFKNLHLRLSTTTPTREFFYLCVRVGNRFLSRSRAFWRSKVSLAEKNALSLNRLEVFLTCEWMCSKQTWLEYASNPSNEQFTTTKNIKRPVHSTGSDTEHVHARTNCHHRHEVFTNNPTTSCWASSLGGRKTPSRHDENHGGGYELPAIDRETR